LLAVGLHCIFANPIDQAPGRVEALARLLVDRRWPWQPTRLQAQAIPGHPRDDERKGTVKAADRLEAYTRALASPHIDTVMTSCSPQNRLDHAWLHVQTGRRRVNDAVYPFALRAFSRAEGLVNGRTIAEWVPLLHDLVTTLSAAHGVIVVEHEDIVQNEIWLVGFSGSGVVPNPRAAENAGLGGNNAKRDELGRRHVRHPRWGNYLAPEHVAAVGGVERLVAAVAPAELRDVGNLLYVQLTSSPASAVSPEGQEKQRLMTALLRPILVPQPGSTVDLPGKPDLS